MIKNTIIRMQARNGDDFITSLAKKMGAMTEKSPSLNAYINRQEFNDVLKQLRASSGSLKNLGTIHIRGRKRVATLHRSFVRNVLQLYRYTFVYLIASSIYRESIPLAEMTTRTELARMDDGDRANSIQPVVAKAPVWLKGTLTDFQIPIDAYFRATQPWVETGRLINAFNVSLKKDAETGDTVITGNVGFTKKGFRKGTDGEITSAEDRATLLEFGGNKQPPRPVIRLIMRSDMFKKNYKLLQDRLRSKLKPSEVKAETVGRKVTEALNTLGE